jgi:pimeloyl-ACP methyl ester carboxylesterase
MAATISPPRAIEALVERFDPEVIDVPGGRARIRLEEEGDKAWDAVVEGDRLALEPAGGREPDALLSADAASWKRVARDVRGGMDAFDAGRLTVRRNLHLGVGFLAATSGLTGPGRLRFRSVETAVDRLSMLEGGTGDPVLCLHGLGGTKASFLPTVAALAAERRVIAFDFPGFGESDKPIGAPYNAAYLAHSATALLEALGLERADLIGNSMGGRVAIEAGLTAPERTDRIVLLSPALAWLRDRRWAGVVRLLRPELGLLQVTPRGYHRGLRAPPRPGRPGGLVGRRRRRVPARLSHPSRRGGLLRRRP